MRQHDKSWTRIKDADVVSDALCIFCSASKREDRFQDETGKHLVRESPRGVDLLSSRSEWESRKNLATPRASRPQATSKITRDLSSAPGTVFLPHHLQISSSSVFYLPPISLSISLPPFTLCFFTLFHLSFIPHNFNADASCDPSLFITRFKTFLKSLSALLQPGSFYFNNVILFYRSCSTCSKWFYQSDFTLSKQFHLTKVILYK